MAIRRQNTNNQTGNQLLEARQEETGNENLNQTANQVARNTTAMQTTEAGSATPTDEGSAPTIEEASTSSIIDEINTTPTVSAQDDLEGQNQQFQFPEATQPVAASSLMSRIDSIMEQSDSALDQERLSQQDQALQQSIAETIGTLSTRGEVTAQLQEQFGIGEKSQQLTDIRNTIRSKSKAIRDQKQRIRNNGALTQNQQEARVAELERKSADELADLAIIEQARQNNLTTARDLVKDKVDLRFSDEQTRLEGLQFFFNQNRDLLNKSTENQIQQNLLEQKTKLSSAVSQAERLEEQKLSILQQADQNGAPNAVLQDIQSAQSVSEARQAAGEFSIDMTERLEQQKLRQDITLNALEKQQRIKQLQAVDEGALTEDQLDTALKLEKSVSGRQGYKDLQDIASGLRGTITSAQQKTGAGDVSMVNAFQRLIDPGATVREGDVQLLQSAQSIYQDAQAKIKRAGGDTVKFSDEFRNNLVETASDLYDAQVNAFVDSVEPIKRNAEARNIDFEEYVLSIPGSSSEVREQLGEGEDETISNIGDDDIQEINSIYGGGSSTTTQEFNPSIYYE